MELRALRYLVAVADAGSVTAGSALVHVSQPAVSRQIRALERELGVDVFVRSEGGVRLTAAGVTLVAQARDLLERETFLKRTATSLAAGRLVSLTIAAPSTTLSDVVAPFLAQRPMAAGAPRVNVVTRSGADAFAALDEGADLVVAPAVPPSAASSMLIAELPVRAYVGAPGVDGEDRRRERKMTLEALAEVDPLVTLPMHHPVRHVLSQAFADAGLAPKHVQEVDSPEAAQALAASGRGVAVLTNDPRFGLIPRRVVDGAERVLTLPLHAAWSSRHHAAAELLSTARELRLFCAHLYRDDLS